MSQERYVSRCARGPPQWDAAERAVDVSLRGRKGRATTRHVGRCSRAFQKWGRPSPLRTWDAAQSASMSTVSWRMRSRQDVRSLIPEADASSIGLTFSPCTTEKRGVNRTASRSRESVGTGGAILPLATSSDTACHKASSLASARKRAIVARLRAAAPQQAGTRIKLVRKGMRPQPSSSAGNALACCGIGFRSQMPVFSISPARSAPCRRILKEMRCSLVRARLERRRNHAPF